MPAGTLKAGVFVFLSGPAIAGIDLVSTVEFSAPRDWLPASADIAPKHVAPVRKFRLRMLVRSKFAPKIVRGLARARQPLRKRAARCLQACASRAACRANPDRRTLASRTALRQRPTPITAIPIRHGPRARAMPRIDQTGRSRISSVSSRIACWASGVGRLCAEMARQSTLTGAGSTSLRTTNSPERAEAATPLAVSTA